MEHEQQELVRFKAGPAMGGEVGRSRFSLCSSFWKKISAPVIICLAGEKFSICPSPCTGAIQCGTSCPCSKAGGCRFLSMLLLISSFGLRQASQTAACAAPPAPYITPVQGQQQAGEMEGLAKSGAEKVTARCARSGAAFLLRGTRAASLHLLLCSNWV